MKNFAALSEQEILALAISLEEEDERVYADFSQGLLADFPATAAIFDGMRLEEVGHRRRLLDTIAALGTGAASPNASAPTAAGGAN